MDIHHTCELSMSSKFDFTYPAGIHIGAFTYIAFEARILCHDRTRGLYCHTYIGRNCFIGGRSLVMPGISIGDNCIIGAGSIVTKDVPPNSMVAGNPAIILKRDIAVTQYGRLVEADQTTKQLITIGEID